MSRRTLFILLFASLALNLFVLGAAVGVYLLGPRLHGPPRDGGPVMMAAAAALPAGQQAAYREALRAEAVGVRPQLRQAWQVRREAWTRLGAEPVDVAGISADLARARALESQARTDVDRTILDFAAKLPAADRAQLGQALAQPPRRGMRREPRPPPAP